MSAANHLAQPSDNGSIAPLAIRSLSRQTRSRRSHAPLAVQMGKHFGRVSEANASFAAIIDTGLEALVGREGGRAVDDENKWVVSCFQDLCRMYDALREPGSRSLKDSLRDSESGVQFRNELCASLQAGRSAGRTDDSIAIERNIRNWSDTLITGVQTLGWSSEKCALLLSTESMDMDNEELREQLRDNITEAPHDEIPLVMFEDEQFPTDPAYPLKGFGRSKIFINALRTIFVGPGAVFSKRSGGSRGKAAKNGMSSFNVQSIAYTAMVLRFVLRGSGAWYRITNEAVDTRYNYDHFYMEMLSLLEDPLFETEVQDLLKHLNVSVFPHAHSHARRIRSEGSSIRQKVADARARRQAAAAAGNDGELDA